MLFMGGLTTRTMHYTQSCGSHYCHTRVVCAKIIIGAFIRINLSFTTLDPTKHQRLVYGWPYQQDHVLYTKFTCEIVDPTKVTLELCVQRSSFETSLELIRVNLSFKTLGPTKHQRQFMLFMGGLTTRTMHYTQSCGSHYCHTRVVCAKIIIGDFIRHSRQVLHSKQRSQSKIHSGAYCKKLQKFFRISQIFLESCSIVNIFEKSCGISQNLLEICRILLILVESLKTQ